MTMMEPAQVCCVDTSSRQNFNKPNYLVPEAISGLNIDELKVGFKERWWRVEAGRVNNFVSSYVDTITYNDFTRYPAHLALTYSYDTTDVNYRYPDVSKFNLVQWTPSLTKIPIQQRLFNMYTYYNFKHVAFEGTLPVAYWDYVRQEINFRYLAPFKNQDLIAKNWDFGAFLAQTVRGSHSLWVYDETFAAAYEMILEPYPPCVVSV